MTRAFRPPPALSPGARIRLVAPSSPFDRDALLRAVADLRARYEVIYDPGLFAREGYLAGSDARRLAEFGAALGDPEAHAVIAARGGYGATRLLGELDVAAVADADRVLVGFSDITALHALWARAGLRSLHAPMVASLGKGTSAERGRRLDLFFAALEGKVPDPCTGLVPLAAGRAAGPLLGGNLAVLTALAGTPYAPPTDGAILFLEDVGERPYRIDRMLTTLRQTGMLENVSGVILGTFTDCAPGEDGVTVEEVLEERLAGLGVPVLAGVPAGHGDETLALPFGAEVELDGAAQTLHFAESALRSA